MNDSNIVQIIKWIFVIIITGFFAQFGKMLAEAIIKKVKAYRRKEDNALNESENSNIPSKELYYMHKLEKKKLKLQKKELKRKKKELKNKD